MKLAIYGCLLLLIALDTPTGVAAEPLTISSLERPPYYYRDTNGEGAGLLLERAR